QPVSAAVGCAQSVSFETHVAAGYSEEGLTYAWRINGTALPNGSTGHGSTISGADTATLIITNAGNGDAGSYDCVVTASNGICGSVTSLPATLTITANCCPADITSNGVVDIDDLVQVIINWGAAGANVTDITRDGIVNIDDLVQVIINWGNCP